MTRHHIECQSSEVLGPHDECMRQNSTVKYSQLTNVAKNRIKRKIAITITLGTHTAKAVFTKRLSARTI